MDPRCAAIPPNAQVSGQAVPCDLNADGDALLRSEELERRWTLVAPHRLELLKVARRRTNSTEDAEDIVGTALLRAVQHPGLDESRVGAFLCTTVKRLAVDLHRQHTRQTAAAFRQASRRDVDRSTEELVCDRAEAAWLADRLGDLPLRERQVLRARTAGLTAQESGATLGISTKAAENAYTRIRQRARGLLAGSLGVVALLHGWCRRAGRAPVAAVPALALVACGLAVTSGTLDEPRGPEWPRNAVDVIQQIPSTVSRDSVPAARLSRDAVSEPRLTGRAPKSTPAPTRTTLRAPSVVPKEVLHGGDVYVETRHEEPSRTR